MRDAGGVREVKDHPYTVAVDLDGTLAEVTEPFDPKVIGKPRKGVVKEMTSLRDAGARIIIWTVRGDKTTVSKWLKTNNVPFDYINENPDQPEGSSAKVYADAYIDDRAHNAVDFHAAVTKVLGSFQAVKDDGKSS